MPVLGTVGAGLLVYLIGRLGPGRIAAELAHLGSVLPIVLAITGSKYWLQAAGWRLVLPPTARPPWLQSVAATITGDALGYLTWAGPFTGEPVRALLMRGTVPVAAGIAAGAAERAMYNLTAAALVWLVLLMLAARADPIWFFVMVAASLVGGVLLARLWGRRLTRRSEIEPAAGESGRDVAATASARPAGRMASFLHTTRQLWAERRSVLPAVAVLCLAQHALLVIEAALMLSVLGSALDLWTVLVFEAVTKIVNTVGVIVPGRLGVSEGGSALLTGALGFGASAGLSLALMRRARALIWAAVGLVLLPWQEARARRVPA